MSEDSKPGAPRLLPIRFDPAGSGQNRNKPCPCGSGKKTKRCHGALLAANVVAKLKEFRKDSPEPGKVCIAHRREEKP